MVKRCWVPFIVQIKLFTAVEAAELPAVDFASQKA